MKRREAKIEIFMGMYLLVFLTILSATQIQIKLFATAGTRMEDALAASNLASAVMDVREYGMTRTIRIENPNEAYMLYCEALRQNLHLDENWESADQDLIWGRVEVLSYEIYNVENNDITVYSFGAEGKRERTIQGGLGSVYTPDGVLVESTSVYSRIGFPVRGILGVEAYAEKDKTVDIVSNLTA